MLLLHTCCTPCALPILEYLDNYYQRRNLYLRSQLALYFYSRNIFHRSEYEKRKLEVKKIAKIYSIIAYYGAYDHNKWLTYLSKNLFLSPADYKENSQRCQQCFFWRLRQLFIFAQMNRFNQVATTLSINMFKDTRFINEVGHKLSRQYKKHPIKYITFDLNSQRAYQREKELLAKYHLYHQHYCGCEFSRKKI